MDDTSLITWGQKEKEKTATFGIRFYAWTAVVFADDDMKNTGNARMNCEAFSGGIVRLLQPYMLDFKNIQEAIQKAENALLRLLNKDRLNCTVLNAVDRMIETHGTAKMKELSDFTGVSKRTLERAFEGMTGVSPKALSSLLRYQMVWQEMISGHFSVMDAVEKYGYTDQAHLLHDFKKRHLMNPGEAVRFAIEHR